MTADSESTFVFLPLVDLIKYVDTLKSCPWEGIYSYNRKTVQTCLNSDLLEARPWDYGSACIQTDPTHDNDPLYHAKRVAFLVKNKCHRPISIDVGIPGLGFKPNFLIDDGCHRLAAAIYRKDEEIAVDFSGSVKEFKTMFPRQRKPKKSEITLAYPEPALNKAK